MSGLTKEEVYKAVRYLESMIGDKSLSLTRINELIEYLRKIGIEPRDIIIAKKLLEGLEEPVKEILNIYPERKDMVKEAIANIVLVFYRQARDDLIRIAENL